MRGIRSRLAVTLLALVALTVTAIGVGTYAFVDARLRDTLVADTGRQVQFYLSALLPGRLPDHADRAAFEATGLPEAFRLRGDAETIVDFGDGDPYLSRPLSLAGALEALPTALRSTIAEGRVGYAWTVVAGRGSLVVGGKAAGGPALYLVVDDGPLEATLAQLRTGLVAAGLAALIVALLTASLIARRILRPVASASAAATRIAAGDLAARVPVDSSDEFGRWAAEFNTMAASLERTVVDLEASQAQNRRFVADVSHELRTPLAALVTEASLIEGSLTRLDPATRRAAELLVADVRRLRALVDDLMELSRFDAGAEQVRLEPVDLGRVVAAAVRARLPEATLDVSPSSVEVVSDVRRLDRIVGNLLDNARVHAPGAPVAVAVGTDAGRVTVEVADRGPGVDADALAHLFDRFYKADPSRGTAGATSGLGLAIAAENAALLGGTLEAEPRPGGGLTFRLTLPVTGSLPPRDVVDTARRDAEHVSDPASGTQP